MVEGPDSLYMQLRVESGAVGHFFACYTAKIPDESIFGCYCVVAWGFQGVGGCGGLDVGFGRA